VTPVAAASAAAAAARSTSMMMARSGQNKGGSRGENEKNEHPSVCCRVTARSSQAAGSGRRRRRWGGGQGAPSWLSFFCVDLCFRVWTDRGLVPQGQRTVVDRWICLCRCRGTLFQAASRREQHARLVAVVRRDGTFSLSRPKPTFLCRRGPERRGALPTGSWSVCFGGREGGGRAGGGGGRRFKISEDCLALSPPPPTRGIAWRARGSPARSSGALREGVVPQAETSPRPGAEKDPHLRSAGEKGERREGGESSLGSSFCPAQSCKKSGARELVASLRCDLVGVCSFLCVLCFQKVQRVWRCGERAARVLL
jgi:hypothetical protein